MSTLQYWSLCWFSRPASDRLLFKTIHNHKPQSLVQIGMDSARQAELLIAVCQRASRTAAIKYTGIDLFEAKGAAANGLTLKEAHRVLSATEAKVRLLPGDAAQTLPRMANQLLATDLLIISSNDRREVLDGCWFFIPRMLHESSLLLLQTERHLGRPFEILGYQDVAALAKAAGRSAPKAA